MHSVAFVTYNSVGEDLSSGWHNSNGRRALVLQNSTGERWCAEQGPLDRTGHKMESSKISSEIDTLWDTLLKALPELDHIVVYIGSSGSRRAIELASELPNSKVTFIGCRCGLPQKEDLIQSVDLHEARRIICECGGHQTMEVLFKSFMDTGEFPTSRKARPVDSLRILFTSLDELL